MIVVCILYYSNTCNPSAHDLVVATSTRQADKVQVLTANDCCVLDRLAACTWLVGSQNCPWPSQSLGRRHASHDCVCKRGHSLQLCLFFGASHGRSVPRIAWLFCHYDGRGTQRDNTNNYYPVYSMFPSKFHSWRK